ncbi:hypothetical protein NQ317_001858 [Molorchus minor]|uniref:Uncharacterized protein n=1 Tax=Molorchus minor TaxID=1323400 RepID=A0ABQ9JYX5_9CUCU|nr:hypothetical protein NQ317_001858 [Molorchus minor]
MVPLEPRKPTSVKTIYNALGFGPRCVGCPPRYCDDDSSIIHGYCCGCRKTSEDLPIRCNPSMVCPINIYELCEQYNYMLGEYFLRSFCHTFIPYTLIGQFEATLLASVRDGFSYIGIKFEKDKDLKQFVFVIEVCFRYKIGGKQQTT